MPEHPETKHRPLTPLMKNAALLDSQGIERKKILEQLGVTGAALKGWRERHDYIALRDEYTEQALQRLAPVLDALRRSAVNAHDEALRVLMDGLDATAVDGTPNWSLRMQAATAIINSPIIRGMVDAKATAADSGNKPAVNAAVNIRIVSGPDGRPAVQYIDHDGEAEEITNELGPGDQDGNDYAEVIAEPEPEPGLDTDGDPDF